MVGRHIRLGWRWRSWVAIAMVTAMVTAGPNCDRFRSPGATAPSMPDRQSVRRPDRHAARPCECRVGELPGRGIAGCPSGITSGQARPSLANVVSVVSVVSVATGWRGCPERQGGHRKGGRAEQVRRKPTGPHQTTGDRRGAMQGQCGHSVARQRGKGFSPLRGRRMSGIRHSVREYAGQPRCFRSSGRWHRAAGNR